MDVKTMTAEQLAESIEQARRELLSRQNESLFGDRLAEVQDEFRAAGILTARPEEYTQPTEIRDAYGRGDVVDWNGERREAVAGFVICTPDCDVHWRDYVEPEPPVDPEPDVLPEVFAWSADMGTLATGTLVSYQDHTYRVITSHTTREEWTPTALPNLFEEVTDA